MTRSQDPDDVNDVPSQWAEIQQLLPYDVVNKEFSGRSDWEGLLQTVFHASCAAITGYAMSLTLSYSQANPTSWLWCTALVLAALAYALVLSFLFMPLHECVHQTAFSSTWPNQLVAFVAGLLTARPPFHYKLYHYAHHRYTGMKEKDPELSNSFIDPDINTLSGYLLYLTALPFWLDRFYTLVSTALLGTTALTAHYIPTPPLKRAIVKEARLFLSIYLSLWVASYMMHSDFLLIYWVLPSFLAQPFLRFYLIAEHNGCLTGVNMLANTRTSLTVWLYRRLAWNMPFHSEHHAFPSVPFHLLPALYQRLGGKTVTESQCQPNGSKGYININLSIVNRLMKKHK